MTRKKCVLAVLLAAAALGPAACSSPFKREDADQILRQRVAKAIDHELKSLPTDSQLQVTTQPEAEVIKTLSERRDELEALSPDITAVQGRFDMGPDLTGQVQQEVALSLRSAIESAVGNNLFVQASRLQPAISEADVVAAEAAFDATFYGAFDYANIEQPQPQPLIGGLPVGPRANLARQMRFETGVRKRTTSGGEVFVSTDLQYFNNRNPEIAFSPDPAWTSAIRLGMTQPLLRGFGTTVNTATIRLSRNMERRSIEQLRSDLLVLLSDTEEAYWDLVLAWQDLAVSEWLLEVGIQVRDVMERRRDFDTKPAEYSDAVARVEQRKAAVIEDRLGVRRASDRLKLLMNDPEVSVGSEALLVPADVVVEEPIRFNLREAVLTAMTNRPEVQQAILNIDDAAIRQMLADNNRLPLLDLAAQMAFYGLDDDAGDAYGELFKGNFIDWMLGLYFEWPIGNRAAEAGYRQARLRRSESVIAYQQAVQEVVLDVKTTLRNCKTAYELIQANRSNRIAQAENLRTLLVEEETLAGLTPEFLNLKFQRQDRLADAQRLEAFSLTAYNQSLANLYRAMGVGLTMNQIQLEVVDLENTDYAAADTSGHDASAGPTQ
jgi:outer membrane protein TolC